MLDFKAAMNDPDEYFDTPQAVLTHPELTTEQKRKLLEQWEQDLIELSTTQAEGMPGTGQELLQAVHNALSGLSKSE